MIFCCFFLMHAQEQATEFNKKIRADSAKNAVSESEAYDSNINIEENKEKVGAEGEIDPELTVTRINFTGLKKTRKSYIEGKLEKFLGDSVAETDMHGLETALQLEGLFDDIKISFERLSDTEAALSVSVKEKITFIPLPFAMYSDSSMLAGGVVMDTNAFGRKDMFMVGAFFSANAKTGMAAFAKNAGESGIPGFSAFFSGSSSTPEINNMAEDVVLKYDAIYFNGGFSVIEKIGEYFTFSHGFSFKSVETDEISDFVGLAPESVKIASTSLSFGYSKSDWNGVFMSTNSASLSAEVGLTDSESGDLRYPKSFSFSIGEQHPLFFSRLRFYLKLAGHYGKNTHISTWASQSAGAVNILPSDFSTERIIGGNAGLEFAVTKLSWGMISIYGDYQLLYAKDFDKDYEFEYGPYGGMRFYLAKIAFPALAMGLAYNVPERTWRFSAAMGMSF